MAEDAAAAEGVEALDDRARVLEVPHAQRAHEVLVEDARLERDVLLVANWRHVTIVILGGAGAIRPVGPVSTTARGRRSAARGDAEASPIAV